MIIIIIISTHEKCFTAFRVKGERLIKKNLNLLYSTPIYIYTFPKKVILKYIFSSLQILLYFYKKIYIGIYLYTLLN